LRIGIIGCGVAGQAAAIALARDGHAVTVFERFASARPLGAGLLLQPSGLRALERLGLREDVEQWGAPVRCLDGRSAKGRRVLGLDYPLGQYGLGIHRGVLFNLLHAALRGVGAALRLDFEVQSIDDVWEPVVTSRKGQQAGPFDLLLDCAGAHDLLRERLNLRVRAPTYEWAAVWAVLPDRTGSFTGALRQVYDGTRVMIGILPLGRAPDDGGQCVAFFWSLKRSEYEREKADGIERLKQRVLQKWPAAKPIVDELNTWSDLSFATYRDVFVRPTVVGHIVVLGDAAHGTSPQLGQGANLALIDAVTLAHCLRDKNLDAALMRYEALRRRHVAFYTLASRAMTPVFQSNSRMIGWLRDALLYPAGKIPGLRYLMRTTLGGVRELPMGIFKLPDQI
jgi:2-polyprenyl-6-methoxyphenol hydroxylase-like FAD-dependent oxidoreductase